MSNNNNEFKGYGLFNDVEDKEVQIHNRARTLVNIMEDHAQGRNVTGVGALICAGYFKSLPEEDRADVHSRTAAMLLEKGFNK